jgi:ParB-like chromosome segregation protein Spo0J
MLSKGTKKRLSRIRRRACAEVQEAFSAGQISARRADTLLYLESEEQRQELARILTEREVAVHRSRIAAEVIRVFVTAGRRDLVALQKHLRCALSRTARAASSI